MPIRLLKDRISSNKIRKKEGGRDRPPSCHGLPRRRSVIASRPSGVLPIDAVEQHGQFGRTQRHARLALRHSWPAKGSLLQTLVDDDEAVLVPVKQLDAVTAFVAKHENMSRQRIPAQMLA